MSGEFDGDDAFASLQNKLQQSEEVANALRAEVEALRARPPPSPCYTSRPVWNWNYDLHAYRCDA